MNDIFIMQSVLRSRGVYFFYRVINHKNVNGRGEVFDVGTDTVNCINIR